MSRISLSSRSSRGRRGGSLGSSQVTLFLGLAVGVLRGAVARDVTSLATSIAGLPGRVERTTIGSSAVTGDVSEFAASVALHRLGLAVASKVVGPAALVASCGTRSSAETPTRSETASKATTRNRSTAPDIRGGLVGAVTLI